MPLSLIQIAGNSYIVSGVNSVGVIVNDKKEAVLIDSGLNSAKDIDKLLRKLEYTVVAIINTHHHPDHCGGNSYFKQRYPELKIYATCIERPFIEHSSLEPNYLSLGATPFKSMTNNTFLEASPSPVTNIIPSEDGCQINIQGITFTIYLLPGHTKGMIGIATEDDVLYCADAIFGRATFDKYGILVYTDIAASRRSFDRLLVLSSQYKHLIAYHGGKIENFSALIELHVNKMDQISQFIVTVLKEVQFLSIDDMTALIIKQFEIPNSISTVPQYLLCRMTIQAYLAYLEHSGKVILIMNDCRLTVQLSPNENEKNVNLSHGSAVATTSFTHESCQVSSKKSLNSIKENSQKLTQSAQKVQEVLNQSGCEFNVVELPDSTRTAQDAAKAIGCELAQIVKSIVFHTKNTKQPILVLVSGANMVDIKCVQHFIGEDIVKADANFVRDVTGFAIGGVPPVGHTQKIITFIDQDLLEFEHVWAAAGTPYAVFELQSKCLESLTGGSVILVTSPTEIN